MLLKSPFLQVQKRVWRVVRTSWKYFRRGMTAYSPALSSMFLWGVNFNQPVRTSKTSHRYFWFLCAASTSSSQCAHPRLHTDTFDFSVGRQPQPASAHTLDFTQILLTSLCGFNLNQPVPTPKTSHRYVWLLCAASTSTSQCPHPRLHTDAFDFSVRRSTSTSQGFTPKTSHRYFWLLCAASTSTSQCPHPRLHTDTFDFSVRLQPQPAKASHRYTFDLTSLSMSLSGVLLLFAKQW